MLGSTLILGLIGARQRMGRARSSQALPRARLEDAAAGKLFSIVILACNRPLELESALTTWAAVWGIAQTPVTVSMDCRHNETLAVVQRWQARPALSHLRLVFSSQVDVVEKNSDERVTRHWLQAVNRCFQKDDVAHVIYAEDDQVVTPDILTSAVRLIAAKPVLCPECFSLNLGCRGNCWGRRSTNSAAVIRMESGNTGVVYSRLEWEKFIAQADTYCDMLGIWDVNVHIMGAMRKISPLSLTYAMPRVHHLSTCFSSRTQRTMRSPAACDHRNEVARFLSAAAASAGAHGGLRDLGRASFVRPPARYPRAPTLTRRRCLETLGRAPSAPLPRARSAPTEDLANDCAKHGVVVVTYASHPGSDDKFCRSQRSCALTGVRRHVLGWRKPWNGLTTKLSGTYAAIRKLPAECVVVFTDAYDVLFTQPISTIVARYRALGHALVFSAECGCWPQVLTAPGACSTSYPISPTPYRFLNSGGWVGTVAAAVPLLRHLVENIQTAANDQAMVSTLYISGHFDIRLDHEAAIFQSMHTVNDNTVVPNCDPRRLLDSDLRVAWTKKRPAIFHFNGNGKSLFADHERRLFPTVDTEGACAVAWDGGAHAKAVPMGRESPTKPVVVLKPNLYQAERSLGEARVFTSLIWALRRLSVEVLVNPSERVPAHAVLVTDTFSTPPPRHPNAYFVDFWGTPSKQVPEGVDEAHFLTPYPYATQNTFLGFRVLGIGVGAAPVVKGPLVVLWGKEPRYMRRPWLGGLVAKFPNVRWVSTTDYAPIRNVRAAGTLPPLELSALLSEAAVVVGTGDPVLGPMGLEAVAHGCVLLQRRFPGNRTEWNNPRLPWQTQHDFADQIGRPWVVSVVPDQFERELRAALARVVGTVAVSHLPSSWGETAYIERVRAWYTFSTLSGGSK